MFLGVFGEHYSTEKTGCFTDTASRKNAGEFLFVDKLKENSLKLMKENRASLFYI